MNARTALGVATGALVAVLVGCAGCTVVRAPGVSDTGAHLLRELPGGDALYDDGRRYHGESGVFLDPAREGPTTKDEEYDDAQ